MSNILRIGYAGMMVNKFRGAIAANNIANLNTTGYKKRRAKQSDLNLNTAKISGRTQVGSGVKIQEVSRINTQGRIFSKQRFSLESLER